MTRFAGRNAVVWGLGRHGGGVAVVRYLVRHGASVVVVDAASEASLEKSITELGDTASAVDLRCNADLAAVDGEPIDLLVVNPAIPIDHPQLSRFDADDSIEMTSEIGLIAHEIQQHRVVAITGSNGKSTVSQWATNALRQVEPSTTVRIGGNFEVALSETTAGNLLDDAPFNADETFVLELSSFQLAHLQGEPLHPQVGAVTNITPNHLDWHRSFADYAAAKRSLLDRSTIALDGSQMPASDLVANDLAAIGEAFDVDVDARNAALVASILNALGHSIAASLLKATQPIIRHRRNVIGSSNGVTFVDDSAATTPESTQVCTHQFGAPQDSKLVIIAGGRNKGFCLDSFAEDLSTRTFAVAALGETGEELADAVCRHQGRAASFTTLTSAIDWALKIVPRGGVVALSPGMASTDLFTDYRDRGDQFRQIVLDRAEISSVASQCETW